MRKWLGVGSVALALALASGPALAQIVEELRAQATQVEADLAEADVEAGSYGEGLIQLLAESRREALLVSKALLEARIQAVESGAPLEVGVPAVAPDEARAAAILEEMETAERRVADAEAEAARYSGGLIQAMAISKVMTEELTLAQLRMGYLQAKYGIAFPVDGRWYAGPAEASTETSEVAAGPENAAAVPAGPEWADPQFPEIDYRQRVFETAFRQGQEISGWWAIRSDRSPISDNPEVEAVNLSAAEGGFSQGPTMVLRCQEGETSLLVVMDDYIPHDEGGISVTLRIDDEPAQEVYWQTLTSNHGAGVPGSEAMHVMTLLDEAQKVAFRIVDRDGLRHDAVFQLAGQEDALNKVAEACGGNP